jgi:ornithine carbamoyltransferase
MLSCARLGVHFSIATPSGYQPNVNIVEEAAEYAAENDVRLEFTTDPAEAVAGANAVYTDVWVSMGQEDETDHRKQVFEAYQVNEQLMAKAASNAVFMHCLPAKRGLEVTDEVIESSRSVVFDQAENRLHTQKALLLTLLQ